MTATMSPAFGTAGNGRKSLSRIRDETVFYPHQIDGIRTMARRTSFLLADEMGLGKTLQALTVAAIDFERGWASRVLAVVPATLKWNWAEEIEKHTTFRYMVLDGSPKVRAAQLDEFAEGGTDILITNYEQVNTHLDALNRFGFDIVIFDEAHYIKNRNANRTKAAHKIKAKRAFVLTGSPLLNQVNDLWGLLHRVDSAAYPSYWRFVNRYAVFGGFKDKQIVGVKNKPELTAEVERVMIRRLKKDVLDLPDKQHIAIHVDFHPTQEKYYKQAEEELKIDLPSEPDPMEIENVLTKLLRLKQICGTPATIGGEDESYKLDRAVEMCQEITHDEPDNPGEPVVVFTQFRGVLEAMEQRLAACKPPVPYHSLHGGVKKELRTGIINTWAHDKHPSVLLAMLQVGGVGLNMTAASKCIFLDKLWTPKMNEQAEDRLHRIGADKTRPIQIYEIIVRKSVEQRIEQILKRKTKLFNTLIEESDWKKALIASMVDDD
jgi:SNF2 family DNA or RNA helicase